MRRIANGTQVAALPTPTAAVGTPGFASNGDPAAGIQATIWDADTANRLIEELMAFLTATGIAPDGGNNAQVLAAVRLLARGAIEIRNNPGAFTTQVPIWATSADVIVTGAGGGSGGNNGSQASGGGGAGGTAIKRIPGLIGGASISGIVGAAGSAGDTSGTGSGANGGKGGTSSFGIYCAATGGDGGLCFAPAPAGGAPGVGSFGDLNLYGGFGNDGQSNGTGYGGAGGGSFWGGGARASTQAGGAGVAGLAPGSGAGGIYGAAARSGGFGADGIVHITWKA